MVFSTSNTVPFWTKISWQTHFFPTMSICRVTVATKILAVWRWNLKVSPYTWCSRRLLAVNAGMWAMLNYRIHLRIHCSSKSIVPDCRWIWENPFYFVYLRECIWINFVSGETVNSRPQHTSVPNACWQVVHVRRTRHYSVFARKLISKSFRFVL